MTRINAHIPPQNLCNQHLMAEYREAKRIPNTIKSGKAVLKNIPSKFTLGTGHVKYFYNKLGYLKRRYEALYEECIRRGFNIQDYRPCFEGISPELLGDVPYSEADRKIVEERIEERLAGMENISYLCGRIDFQTSVKILKK